MNFEWVAIALGDVVWISLAFALGLLSRSVGLPPLVGFLATGFLLNTQGIASGEMLQKLADLGITLLLFTVGLKLNLRTLARPQVWAVSGLHMATIVAVFGFAIYGLALAGTPFVSNLDLQGSLLIAFALSFSSTVFVVKVLEEKGEMKSLYGRIAIGILIMQDIAAVVFLAASTGKLPSPWALLLLLLIPLRPMLQQILQRVGHGELLVLYGLILALGGAEVFELVGMKGGFGALILGVLIADHAKSDEMAKTLLGFKDLFLLGFFLSVGLAGQPTLETFLVGALLTPIVFFKSTLFFMLLAHFKLRARTSLLTTLNLTNYSEFGLIVTAIGVANGWIDSEWLLVIAVALALSFVIAASLNSIAHQLYAHHRPFWRRLQRNERLPDDSLFDTQGATIAVIGMGRVGAGAYDKMHNLYGDTVVGVDFDPVTVRKQQSTGRTVLQGDPSDADFWDRVAATHTIELVMLALPNLTANLSVLNQLEESHYPGRVAACARYPDEVEKLQQAGAVTVFNIYTEAGAGFATHVAAQLPE
ncbi:MAG: cation:proton antiporter [Pseudomonadales bacterium]